MYKLTNKPLHRKVTSKECAEFLEFNNFQGQRALTEAKARRYSELLIQGKLRPVEVAFATGPDNNRYLMNGQHVCQGGVWANREMDCILTYYRCETWHDMWELFATFDVHASRTQGQIFKAARGLFSNHELRDVPLRVMSSCGTALASIRNGTADFYSKSSTADKISKPTLVENNPKDVLWVNRFSEADFMMRVGCVTAMMVTHRKSPEKADEFWGKVQSGLGFKSKSEPEKRVHDFLNSFSGSKSSSGRNHHEIVYGTCISWWNSWITGTPRNSVKIAAMQEMPKVQG